MQKGREQEREKLKCLDYEEKSFLSQGCLGPVLESSGQSGKYASHAL